MNARITSLATEWSIPAATSLAQSANGRRGGSGPPEPNAGCANRRALAEPGDVTHASSRGRRRWQRSRIEHDSLAAVDTAITT